MKPKKVHTPLTNKQISNKIIPKEYIYTFMMLSTLAIISSIIVGSIALNSVRFIAPPSTTYVNSTFSFSVETVTTLNATLSTNGLSFIRNDIGIAVVTLPDPPISGFKEISIQDFFGYPAQIITASGAAFTLGPDVPTRLMYYDTTKTNRQNKWQTLDSISSFAFYPTKQQAKISPIDAIPPSFIGFDSSMSNYGHILVFGGPLDDGETGACWVYMWTELLGWTQMQKLVATDAIGSAAQGTSVSVSGTGNTVACCGFEDDSGVGACWIYTLVNGVWTQQIKLVPSNYTSPPLLGVSSAFNSDGSTIAIGGYGDGSGVGAVWIWTFNGIDWIEQAKLTANDTDGSTNLGNSVSISGDGNIVAAGGSGDNGDIGATWIFERTQYGDNAGTWTQIGSKLVGTGYIGGPQQGVSVSLSSAGTALISSGYNDNNGIGAVWIYESINGVWQQQGDKIVPQDVEQNAFFGYSVWMSSHGSTIIVGATTDNTTGGYWSFAKSLNTFYQATDFTVPGGIIGDSIFCGAEIFGNGDGSIITIPCFGDNDNTGAVFIFV